MGDDGVAGDKHGDGDANDYADVFMVMMAVVVVAVVALAGAWAAATRLLMMTTMVPTMMKAVVILTNDGDHGTRALEPRTFRTLQDTAHVWSLPGLSRRSYGYWPYALTS